MLCFIIPTMEMSWVLVVYFTWVTFYHYQFCCYYTACIDRYRTRMLCCFFYLFFVDFDINTINFISTYTHIYGPVSHCLSIYVSYQITMCIKWFNANIYILSWLQRLFGDIETQGIFGFGIFQQVSLLIDLLKYLLVFFFAYFLFLLVIHCDKGEILSFWRIHLDFFPYIPKCLTFLFCHTNCKVRKMRQFWTFSFHSI